MKCVPNKHQEEHYLDMSYTQSTWLIVSFASFLTVFATGRGNVGEAK